MRRRITVYVFVLGDTIVRAPVGKGMAFHNPIHKDRHVPIPYVGGLYRTKEEALAFDPWHPELLREATLTYDDGAKPKRRKAKARSK